MSTAMVRALRKAEPAMAPQPDAATAEDGDRVRSRDATARDGMCANGERLHQGKFSQRQIGRVKLLVRNV